ncbi:hypothetical protein [Pelagibaculum spongiae]|uniref:Outer membrane protein beta-barrel domain-containing protein n=1 Tax=Pelagibaculum spongiae TaxID=2080658 RepID=A0A2V1H1U9_9GAMM|nr:hypothetical protein [Pelagibaculum spongiae]PVZ71940.1 hypothetical protein DC094_02645 [Pelagibaculum spongiae]
MKKVVLLLSSAFLATSVNAESGFEVGLGFASRSIDSFATNGSRSEALSDSDSGASLTLGASQKLGSSQFGVQVVIPNSEDDWYHLDGFYNHYLTSNAYVGGVLGYMSFSSEYRGLEVDYSGVSAGVKTGYSFSDKLSMDLTYRFLTGDKDKQNFDFVGVTVESEITEILELSLRAHF